MVGLFRLLCDGRDGSAQRYATFRALYLVGIADRGLLGGAGESDNVNHVCVSSLAKRSSDTRSVRNAASIERRMAGPEEFIGDTMSGAFHYTRPPWLLYSL
jgi:hypothetical protein